MRKTINFSTYSKIKKHFINNPKEGFTPTTLRDTLNIDYESVLLSLKILLEERTIQKKKEKYSFRQNITEEENPWISSPDQSVS